MKTIKIIAKYQKERDQLVLSLASLGYKVWVMEIPGNMGYDFYVLFEIDDKFILENK